MYGFDDYCVIPPSVGQPAVGICHARGMNENVPAQWLIYITVAEVNASIATCLELFGTLLIEPRDLGSYGTICVIQDLAGAVAALQSTSREASW